MNTTVATASPKAGNRKPRNPAAKPTSKVTPVVPAGKSRSIKLAATAKPAATITTPAKPSKPTQSIDPARQRRTRCGIEIIVEADQTIERISKQARLIALLREKEGATLSAMMAATGWQAHSVRGVISGILRKKLGLDVTLARQPDGSSTYRIVA